MISSRRSARIVRVMVLGVDPKNDFAFKCIFGNERRTAILVDVLNAVPRLEGNPYVICGEKAGRHLVDLERPWRRIRKAAKLDDVRLHDLRHSFASVTASGGQSLVVIGKMLGHSQPATTARYAHLADDPVRAASDAVGRHIAAAMAGGTSGEVVDLPRSRSATTKLDR